MILIDNFNRTHETNGYEDDPPYEKRKLKD